MRLLLDTHTFLWWCANDPKLSAAAVAAIGEASSEVFVSAVSAWEISIKARLGKLPLPEPPDVFIAMMVKQHAFGVLGISLSHAVGEFNLPAHHNDPFDRLLIAQASYEKLTLVTGDAKIAEYNVQTLW